MLQTLCNQHVQWDDVVSPGLRKDWERWEQKLKGVVYIHIPSCIKPRIFGKIIETSFHHFSDALEKWYGQCSYIRLVNDKGKIHCSLLVGKSRVTTKKFLSNPRIELTAAVLSVKMTYLIRKELNFRDIADRLSVGACIYQKHLRKILKFFWLIEYKRSKSTLM